MTDSFKIQVNVKVPHDTDNYRDTLVNIRADSAEELTALLDYVENNGAKIGSVVAALRAGANVGNAFVPPSPAPQQDGGASNYGTAPGAPAGSWSQQGSQQAPPAFVPQQQAAPQAAAPAASCVHGPMVFRSGTKNGKAWSAHFCPQPKGQPQCDPVWGK